MKWKFCGILSSWLQFKALNVSALTKGHTQTHTCTHTFVRTYKNTLRTYEGTHSKNHRTKHILYVKQTMSYLPYYQRNNYSSSRYVFKHKQSVVGKHKLTQSYSSDESIVLRLWWEHFSYIQQRFQCCA